MTDAIPPGSAHVGAILDARYRLDADIGAGAMATVYRAFDQDLGRTVAVKVFRPGTTDAGDERRRESEKRLLASLSHSSLVTLFDARLGDPARSYLVMEYIDGGTLTDRLARGPVSPADAASLAGDLGEALHVVHAAGIIHRDIKPSNILLRPPLTPDHTFRAVLADFGIAYLVDTARVTSPGMAVGTAAYISPEQVRGAEPTPASDIYSLGLVLIEAMTGRRAFPQPNSGEAIAARLSTPPQIPSTLGYAWRSLLGRMTAVDPLERPTAIEVAAAARGLDAPTAEPDAAAAPTQVAPAAIVTGSAIADSSAPAFAGAAERPPTAPTRVLAGSRYDSDADAASAHVPGAETTRPTRRRVARRRVATALAALAAAAMIAVVAVVWSSAGGSPSPVPSVSAEPVPSATPTEDVVQPAATTAPSTPAAPVATNGNSGNENSGPGNNNGNDDKDKGKGKDKDK